MSSGAPTASEPRPAPPFTEEHERLRLQMRSFIAERLRPHADEWEAAGWFSNDAFRWVADAGRNHHRALLRVVGPPYYSLLRALDRGDRDGGPCAFVERAPRLLVEVGHAHPLLDRIKPPSGIPNVECQPSMTSSSTPPPTR